MHARPGLDLLACSALRPASQPESRLERVSVDCVCLGACAGPALACWSSGSARPRRARSRACQPASERSMDARIPLERHEPVRFEVVDALQPQSDAYLVCFDYLVERAPFN